MKQYTDKVQLMGSNVKDYEIIVPDDNKQFPKMAIGLIVGTAGDLALVKPNGEEIIIPFALVPSRVILNYPCKQIKATGTTAADIMVVYGE